MPPGDDASRIDGRPDPQADDRGIGPRAMELEPDAGRLRLGKARTGGALRGFETRELDDPRSTGDHELDRDVDLAKGDIEWIGSRSGRGLRADFMHVSTVRRAPKRERVPIGPITLNKDSTMAASHPGGQGSRMRYPTPGSALMRSCVVPFGSAAASFRRNRLM